VHPTRALVTVRTRHSARADQCDTAGCSASTAANICVDVLSELSSALAAVTMPTDACKLLQPRFSLNSARLMRTRHRLSLTAYNHTLNEQKSEPLRATHLFTRTARSSFDSAMLR
jgi:hypothetical protein